MFEEFFHINRLTPIINLNIALDFLRSAERLRVSIL